MSLFRLYSIGDSIGLFPIAYAERIQHATMPEMFDKEEDRFIVSEVVDKE